MPLSLRLTHPAEFKTRTLETKSVEGVEQRAAHKIDNKILDRQSKLTKAVTQDKVTLGTFVDTVSDLERIARGTAKLRVDGFSKEERTKINAAFKKVGRSKPKKIDPELKALYNQLKSGKLSAKEAAQELNWRTQEAYGSVVVDRTGPVFQEERYKLRAHLAVLRKDKAGRKKESYVHPQFPQLIEKAIDIFPLIDLNRDGVVDRREARTILTEYVSLDLTPAEATTLYSRQKQLASAVDPETSKEALKMEDLEILLPANYPENPSEELVEVVTKVSKRLKYQLKSETPEPAPFTLGETFQPNNVKQGKEGSCWFLCNLPALTSEDLEDVIKPEGDAYRVTLADGRNTLVHELNEAERRVYSHGDGSWSGLLEKGVSQILSESNKDINGGFSSTGRKMLTGKSSVKYRLIDAPKTEDAPDLRDRDVLFETMEEALDSGSAIFASALKDDYEEDISEISAFHHAYTVLDVNREEDIVTVRNPWGRSERADLDGVNDGVFELTQDQFFANYTRIYLDKPA